jgi:hypothetical protein
MSMQPVTLTMNIETWSANGIRHTRLSGPHERDHKYGGDRTETVYRLELFANYPVEGQPGDFYFELDRNAVINLRNGLSAALLATHGQ